MNPTKNKNRAGSFCRSSAEKPVSIDTRILAIHLKMAPAHRELLSLEHLEGLEKLYSATVEGFKRFNPDGYILASLSIETQKLKTLEGKEFEKIHYFNLCLTYPAQIQDSVEDYLVEQFSENNGLEKSFPFDYPDPADSEAAEAPSPKRKIIMRSKTLLLSSDYIIDLAHPSAKIVQPEPQGLDHKAEDKNLERHSSDEMLPQAHKFKPIQDTVLKSKSSKTSRAGKKKAPHKRQIKKEKWATVFNKLVEQSKCLSLTPQSSQNKFETSTH